MKNRGALMALTLSLLFATGLLLVPSTMAQPVNQNVQSAQQILMVMKETENPGILPDSPFYGLKLGFEKLRLMLIRDRIKRAEMALELAQKRLREAKMLAVMGKPQAMEKAIRNYDRIMERLEKELENARAENDTERAAMIENLMMQLEMQMSELDDAESTAEIAIPDNATREEVLQRMEQLRKRIQERKEKLEARREMIKEMLKKRYNLTDEQVDSVLRKAERRMMEKNIKARAELEMKKANRTLVFVETLISKMESRNVSEERLEHAREMMEEAEELYKGAVKNYNEGDYFTAWELAKESQRMARLAIAMPNERALYRFLERKKIREGYACGPKEAEVLASKFVPGSSCRVTADFKGVYSVRCRVRDRIEWFMVRGKDCEIREVRTLSQLRKEIAKEIRLRREAGNMYGEIERHRKELGDEIREKIQELIREKGNVAPEDIQNVIKEVREEHFEEEVSEAIETEHENATTETEVEYESENESVQEMPPMPVKQHGM